MKSSYHLSKQKETFLIHQGDIVLLKVRKCVRKTNDNIFVNNINSFMHDKFSNSIVNCSIDNESFLMVVDKASSNTLFQFLYVRHYLFQKIQSEKMVHTKHCIYLPVEIWDTNLDESFAPLQSM